jgi:hypothetical protein
MSYFWSLMKILDILGCHSLEAHLSGAIVAQQGPKDQPGLLASGPWLGPKTGGFMPSANT